MRVCTNHEEEVWLPHQLATFWDHKYSRFQQLGGATDALDHLWDGTSFLYDDQPVHGDVDTAFPGREERGSTRYMGFGVFPQGLADRQPTFIKKYVQDASLTEETGDLRVDFMGGKVMYHRRVDQVNLDSDDPDFAAEFLCAYTTAHDHHLEVTFKHCNDIIFRDATNSAAGGQMMTTFKLRHPFLVFASVACMDEVCPFTPKKNWLTGEEMLNRVRLELDNAMNVGVYCAALPHPMYGNGVGMESLTEVVWRITQPTHETYSHMHGYTDISGARHHFVRAVVLDMWGPAWPLETHGLTPSMTGTLMQNCAHGKTIVCKPGLGDTQWIAIYVVYGTAGVWAPGMQARMLKPGDLFIAPARAWYTVWCYVKYGPPARTVTLLVT